MDRWRQMAATLAGDALALPAGTGRKFHREERFSSEALRLITRIFGADPDDITPKPVSKRSRCTAAGIVSAA